MTVADDDFQVVLGVASSNWYLMHVVHLTKIAHHRLWAREQLTQIANKPVLPSQTHTHTKLYLLTVKKVKLIIPHLACRWGAHLPYLGLEPVER